MRGGARSPQSRVSARRSNPSETHNLEDCRRYSHFSDNESGKLKPACPRRYRLTWADEVGPRRSPSEGGFSASLVMFVLVSTLQEMPEATRGLLNNMATIVERDR